MATNKIVLITGANKGIGYEVAKQLAEQGFTVLLGARDRQRGEAAADALRVDGKDIVFVPLDVTNEQSLNAAAEEVAERWGKVDVLVNNAGANYEFSTGNRPSQLDVETLKATSETNVFGVFAVIHHFLPLLQKSEAAQIVNVSSTLGSLTAAGNPDGAYYGINTLAYNASKTALNALTVSLAKDLSAEQISVNSICPGWVQTDMGSAAAPRTVEQGATVITKLAMMETPPTGQFFDEVGGIPW
jgi:NAD(P)-dependent dehydrogenase (short-subunit alcohol dehydrogenase family)